MALTVFIKLVSIHAPNEGSDDNWYVNTKYGRVSIHAPNEGSDERVNTMTERDYCFNPRSQ